jgi:phosphatidylinositol phospholipase C delta
MGTYKCCIFFTRRFALADTTTPEDVRALFSRYAGGSPYMLADDLRRYLVAWGGADGEVPDAGSQPHPAVREAGAHR